MRPVIRAGRIAPKSLHENRCSMENTLRQAFASQRSAPNKRLADMIARVEKKYGIDSAELDDEALGWVSAAGEQNYPLSKKEDEDE